MRTSHVSFVPAAATNAISCSPGFFTMKLCLNVGQTDHVSTTGEIATTFPSTSSATRPLYVTWFTYRAAYRHDTVKRVLSPGATILREMRPGPATGLLVGSILRNAQYLLPSYNLFSWPLLENQLPLLHIPEPLLSALSNVQALKFRESQSA